MSGVFWRSDMAGLTASSRSEIARRLDGKDRFKELRTSILDPQNPSDYIKNISNLWEDAQKTFLEIGNQLMLAKRNLPHGDFEDMVRVRLPFSTTVAYQLRVVAEAIEQRIVSKDELPPSYSIIYKVVKLSDTERAVARQRNIIRPTVKRRELDSFIAELRNVHANGSERDRDELLRLRYRQLLEQKQRLLDEIRQVEEELGLSRESGEILEGSATVVD
jgi:hypothetical protein